MKSIKSEFPNPVLAEGRDDYMAGCSFATHLDPEKITVDSENIVIPVSYSLISSGLQSYINDGAAAVVMNVRSSAASYSRVFPFPKGSTEMSIAIPKYDVTEKIEISGSVIATQDISDFHCKDELDEVYFHNQTFAVRKGDILAYDNGRTVYIDDTELEKPLTSIFSISNVPDQEEDIQIDFSGQKIEIRLKPELFSIYNQFRDYNNGSLRRYLTAVIVYPVLIEAISRIQLNLWSDDRDVAEADLRWFRAILLKAQNIGIDLNDQQDSVTSLADRMLGNISASALISFKDAFESDIDNGDIQYLGGND